MQVVKKMEKRKGTVGIIEGRMGIVEKIIHK